MQLFETVVHNDKANILNSISTNIYLESNKLARIQFCFVMSVYRHRIQNVSLLIFILSDRLANVSNTWSLKRLSKPAVVFG